MTFSVDRDGWAQLPGERVLEMVSLAECTSMLPHSVQHVSHLCKSRSLCLFLVGLSVNIVALFSKDGVRGSANRDEWREF
jgi:hypothetical protein